MTKADPMRIRAAVLVIFGLLALSGLLALPSVAHSATRQSAAPAVVPGDWPMYGHDAARTNYNPAETLLTRGTVTQLVSRWQMSIGNNNGHSSSAPSVADGRVFVGSGAPSGPNFYAFDAGTGALSWSVPLSYTNDCWNVGIGATPAISGNVVVAGGGDPAYYGLAAATGQQLWRQPLNAGPSAFAWASPLINGSRAYLGVASYCDNPSVRGEVRAVDVTTGGQLANQYFVPAGQAGAGIWNSPALSPDGNTLVVATGEDYNGYNGPYNRAMVSLNPLSLQILQAHQEPSPNNDEDFGTTPIIFHDSQNRTLVGATHKNGTFYAYLLSNITAGAVWSRGTGVNVGVMPAYDPTAGAGGTLFIMGGGAQLYAVDPATGNDRWPSITGGMAGNVALANGMLFMNEGTQVRVFDDSTGALLTTLTPAQSGPTSSGIAVANGFVYWVGGNYLNAWSLPAGAATPTPPPAPSATPPPVSSATRPPAPSATRPPGPSSTPPPLGPSATPTLPAATATACAGFRDVHPADYFYTPVQYLVAHGVISGYGDCTYRPYNTTTRAQMVKIVVLGFAKPISTPAAGAQTFADVPPGFPFFAVIETAAADGIVNGYGCGGFGEPCDGQHRPYFRPYANVTRGQLAKIAVVGAGWPLVNPAGGTFADVAPGSAFYPFVETASCRGIISGYACGGPGESCDGGHRAYFRQYNSAVRGQIAKIVYLALTAGASCAAP